MGGVNKRVKKKLSEYLSIDEVGGFGWTYHGKHLPSQPIHPPLPCHTFMSTLCLFPPLFSSSTAYLGAMSTWQNGLAHVLPSPLPALLHIRPRDVPNLMAVSTSSSLTYSRRCIMACASDILMMLSRWRTAMGMPWLTADSRLSSVYTCVTGRN